MPEVVPRNGTLACTPGRKRLSEWLTSTSDAVPTGRGISRTPLPRRGSV